MKNKLMLIILMISTLFSMNLRKEDFIDKTVKRFKGQFIERSFTIEVENIKEFNKEELLNSVPFMYKLTIDVDDSALVVDGRVMIKVTSQDEKIPLYQLKKDILKKVKREDNSVKIYDNIKAKIEDKDIQIYKESLDKYLKSIGGKNIDFTNINSGVSCVATINMNTEEQLKNMLFNVNFALVKYTSGTYIIIGTPIITCAY